MYWGGTGRWWPCAYHDVIGFDSHPQKLFRPAPGDRWVVYEGDKRFSPLLIEVHAPYAEEDVSTEKLLSEIRGP